MKRKHEIILSSDQRRDLFKLISEGKGGKEKLNRARILLKADIGDEGEGWHDSDICDALYVGSATVLRTRKSFVEEGLEATLNRKIPIVKQKRIIEGDEEAHLIALVCSQPPEGNSGWTLRLLKDRMIELNYVETVSHETIRNVLKKTNLNLGGKRNGASLHALMPRLSAKWKKSSTSTKPRMI
jgi:Homeodomain-like domain